MQAPGPSPASQSLGQVVNAKRLMGSNAQHDKITGSLGVRVLFVLREDIIRMRLFENKVHTNLYMKLTFMLLCYRHRARGYCSPRSRTSLIIIQHFNALTLAGSWNRFQARLKRIPPHMGFLSQGHYRCQCKGFWLLSSKIPGSGLCSLTCPATCQALGGGLAGRPL